MSVINVAICVDGLGENWLGGVNYFRNLIAVFDAAVDPALRLHLLTDDPGFLGDMRLSPRIQVHRLAMLKRNSASWAVRKALQVATGRDLQLIEFLKKLDVRAVVFSYVAGASAAGIRCLPWIPDFQFKHHPGLSHPAVAAAEQRRAEKLLRDGDGLVVSSQAAAQDAINFFSALPARLHVLRFAPRVDFQPLQDTSLRDRVFVNHGIKRPYVFLPNQYWQHKNHGLVTHALTLLRQQGGAAPLVVSTGKTADARNPAHFQRFATDLQRSGLGEAYRILGVIPRQDMLVLLAHSLAVLNPSRFEGWSSTVEEAKALGKPLLVSDIPVHREQIAGRIAAQVFGVDDAAALALLLADLHKRHAQADVAAFPPQPDNALYLTFQQEYMALLRRVAAPHGALA